MTSQTRSRSVAAARSSLSKPNRSLIIKGRICQRYVRGYQTNPRNVYPYSRALNKIKCGLYIVTTPTYQVIAASGEEVVLG
jgi:hypothetical protein